MAANESRSCEGWQGPLGRRTASSRFETCIAVTWTKVSVSSCADKGAASSLTDGRTQRQNFHRRSDYRMILLRPHKPKAGKLPQYLCFGRCYISERVTLDGERPFLEIQLRGHLQHQCNYCCADWLVFLRFLSLAALASFVSCTGDLATPSMTRSALKRDAVSH